MELEAQLRKVDVLVLGNSAEDKAAVVSCIIGQHQSASSVDVVRSTAFYLPDHRVLTTLHECQRFGSDLKESFASFTASLKAVDERTHSIDRVFMVFSSLHSTAVDQSLLDMIMTLTTPAFQSIIQVIFMHTPQDLQTPAFLDAVASQLSFLGPTKEAVLQRVLFLDLIDSEIFQSATARNEAIANWGIAQNTLRDVLSCPTTAVKVKDVRRMTWLGEMLVIHSKDAKLVTFLLIAYFIIVLPLLTWVCAWWM